MEKIFVKGFFVLFLFVVSCSDDESGNKEVSATHLIGSWSRTVENSEGKTIETYMFKNASGYTHNYQVYGFGHGPVTELGYETEDSGDFRVEGDSLFLEPNGATGNFSTQFWVSENALYFRYTSSPADAPVTSQLHYDRVD
ncbi:hypothetical protein [Flagellimonas iocasae]|uniref:Lipocalin-like domain-containing protein n=1 Tax=Flagellimonas iocasae TaxID=2055905 RepID=A0ABW4XVK9_9FLAO